MLTRARTRSSEATFLEMNDEFDPALCCSPLSVAVDPPRRERGHRISAPKGTHLDPRRAKTRLPTADHEPMEHSRVLRDPVAQVKSQWGLQDLCELEGHVSQVEGLEHLCAAPEQDGDQVDGDLVD